MANDGLTELAIMLKDRDKKTPLSITTGTVVSPPPKPLIALGDVISLDGSRLIFSSHLLNGYERRIKFKETDWGETTTVNDGGQGASNHKHYVNLTNEDALIEWTDTLVKGDEVILVPVSDGQLYYVIDKAVRF
ncbi:DUF2577 domain-containing protein [Sporosarcina sp. FSL K6-1522]|uniref:DUF2577 domain-containing protein n=1 Tax=Sporosarcina sp. FSL K6-1522 TaxID=2921554 RepID=UPI00315A0576